MSENRSMSTRERWVIYPLLFLALGFALKPKFAPPEKFLCGELECSNLIVTKSAVGDGQINAVSIRTGGLRVDGNIQANGDLAVQKRLAAPEAIFDLIVAKTIRVEGNNGKTRMMIGTPQMTNKDGTTRSSESGKIEIYGKAGKPILTLGSSADDEGGVVIAARSDSKSRAILEASAEGGKIQMLDSSGLVHLAAGHLPLHSGIRATLFAPSLVTYWWHRINRPLLPKPLPPPMLPEPPTAGPSDNDEPSSGAKTPKGESKDPPE